MHSLVMLLCVYDVGVKCMAGWFSYADLGWLCYVLYA